MYKDYAKLFIKISYKKFVNSNKELDVFFFDLRKDLEDKFFKEDVVYLMNLIKTTSENRINSNLFQANYIKSFQFEEIKNINYFINFIEELEQDKRENFVKEFLDKLDNKLKQELKTNIGREELFDYLKLYAFCISVSLRWGFFEKLIKDYDGLDEAYTYIGLSAWDELIEKISPINSQIVNYRFHKLTKLPFNDFQTVLQEIKVDSFLQFIFIEKLLTEKERVIFFKHLNDSGVVLSQLFNIENIRNLSFTKKIEYKIALNEIINEKDINREEIGEILDNIDSTIDISDFQILKIGGKSLPEMFYSFNGKDLLLSNLKEVVKEKNNYEEILKQIHKYKFLEIKDILKEIKPNIDNEKLRNLYNLNFLLEDGLKRKLIQARTKSIKFGF